MGIEAKPQVPFIAFLSKAKTKDMDFNARVISAGQPHKALPLTITLCLSVAAKIKGSIAYEMMGSHDQEQVRIGMPSGILTAGADIKDNKPVSGAFFRTAKKIFKGEVYV